MNGRTTIPQFLVPPGKDVPANIKKLQRRLPSATLVCLSPGVAERVYGPGRRESLARAWTDRIDGWLPLDLVLCGLVCVRSHAQFHRDGIRVDAVEAGEPHEHLLEARLCFTHMDGTETILSASLRVGLLGEVPRLVVMLGEDSYARE